MTSKTKGDTCISSGWWTAFEDSVFFSFVSEEPSSDFVASSGIRWVSKFGLKPSLFTVLNNPRQKESRWMIYSYTLNSKRQEHGFRTKKLHKISTMRDKIWTQEIKLREREGSVTYWSRWMASVGILNKGLFILTSLCRNEPSLPLTMTLPATLKSLSNQVCHKPPP